ncbi:MAG: DUF1640 domain-containing protein [Magnetococcales bacterium]|nr:DUF1640 domain-containing protein [Magnetococcales bacterium]
MATIAIPFDTLAFVKELESAGVPPAQAEVQAKVLSGVLQRVEEARLKELVTKGDLELAKVELRKEIEAAKVETIKWVVATAIVILGGVVTINRFFPPFPIHYPPFAQEMRLPTAPTHGQGVPAPSR